MVIISVSKPWDLMLEILEPTSDRPGLICRLEMVLVCYCCMLLLGV